MKSIVLDGIPLNPGDLSWEGLKVFGEAEIYDRTEPGMVSDRIGEAQAVFTNKVKITREVFEACPSIQYIQVMATGYDIIDMDAAREYGVTVCNVPAYGSETVGQFAIALLLEVCHHIGAHSISVKSGDWGRSGDWCYWNYPLIELAGKTAGIIGFGKIGQVTGRIAKALGMNILAYDGHPTDSGRDIGVYVELDELFGAADVIFLHCPLFPDTAEMISQKSIAKMKDGVILINNSRGGLVNEQDLAEALRTGKVAAAALDVVSEEPIPDDNVLLAEPNCMITPHMSWATKESRNRILKFSLENFAAWLDGNPRNVV